VRLLLRNTSASRWSALNPRHLLSVLTAWFGLCWALIEFASFLAARYGVPEHWIDTVFTAMWAFLPALMLIAWWIGAPGPMRWTRPRLALAALLCGFGVVTVWRFVQTDAHGDVAPLPAATTAADSTRTPRIALFPFAVDRTNVTHAWLGDALPVLAEHDLLYDARLRADSVASSAAPTFVSTLRGYGIATIESAPLALRRRASQSLGYDALVVGSIAVVDERLRLRVELLQLDPDRALGPFELDAADAWEAVDRVAALVRDQLIAADDPRPASDPSLRSISTESLVALKAFVGGAVASQREDGRAEAEALFAEAVRSDPSFVMAEISQQELRHRRGEVMAANLANAALEPKLGVLPDRFRYRFQARLAMDAGQFERARRIYTLWAEQLPDDHDPRLGLVRLDLSSHPDDPAIWQTLVALTEQHGSTADLLYLSAAALRREQAADARRLASAGLARDPADARMKLRMAEIERVSGYMGVARAYLDEAWLLRPDLLSTRIILADFQNGDGDWHSALATLDDARLRSRDNPAVLMQVLEAQVQLLAELGRVEAADRLLDELVALKRAQLGPVDFKFWAAQKIPLRVDGRGEEQTRAWLAEIAPVDDVAFESYFQSMADERIAFAMHDPGRYRQAVRRMGRHWLDSFGISAETGMQLHEALAVAWERNDAASVEGLEAALHAVRNLRVSTDDLRLAAVDQALRRRDTLAARRMLAPLLRGQSSRASMQWRAARIAAIEGDRVQARRQLEPLLDAWGKSDARFEPMREARALAEELGVVTAVAVGAP